MGIYAKINEARGKITYVKKEGVLRFGNAPPVSVAKHDDVISACRDILIECGIFCSLNLEGFRIENGVGIYNFRMVFVDIDKDVQGDEKKHYVDYTTVADASQGRTDMRDTGKAFSFAKKTILLSELQIVTCEDEEQTYVSSKTQAKKVTSKKASELRSRLKHIGKEEESYLKWFNALKNTNYAYLNQVTSNDIEDVEKYIAKAEESYNRQKKASSAAIDNALRDVVSDK